MSIHMSFSYIKHNLCKKTTRMERQHYESLDLLLRCVCIYIYIYKKPGNVLQHWERDIFYLHIYTHSGSQQDTVQTLN